MKDGLKALKAKLVVKKFKQIYGANKLEEAEKKVDDTIDKLQATKKEKILNVKDTASAVRDKKPKIIVSDKVSKEVGLLKVIAQIESQERKKAKSEGRKPEKYNNIGYKVKRKAATEAFAKIGAPLMDKREEFLKDKPNIQQKINELVKKYEKSPTILKAICAEAKRADQEYDIGLLDMVMKSTIDRFHVLHEKLKEKIPEVLALKLKQETLNKKLPVKVADIKDLKSNVVRAAYDVGSTKSNRVNKLFEKVRKEANNGTLPVSSSQLHAIKNLIVDVDNLGKKNLLNKLNKKLSKEKRDKLKSEVGELQNQEVQLEYNDILLRVGEVYGDFKKLHNKPNKQETKVLEQVSDISASGEYSDELPSKTNTDNSVSKSNSSSHNKQLSAKNDPKLKTAIKNLANAKVKAGQKQAIPGHKKPSSPSISH